MLILATCVLTDPKWRSCFHDTVQPLTTGYRNDMDVETHYLTDKLALLSWNRQRNNAPNGSYQCARWTFLEVTANMLLRLWRNHVVDGRNDKGTLQNAGKKQWECFLRMQFVIEYGNHMAELLKEHWLETFSCFFPQCTTRQDSKTSWQTDKWLREYLKRPKNTNFVLH